MNSKTLLLLFVVNVHLVLSTTEYRKEDRQTWPQFFQKLTKKHRPYSFQYGVNDEQTGTQFKRNENSDGKLVTGSYSTQLPDGRTQIVNYKADHKKGYQAEVTYQGEAKHPDQSNKKLYKPILLQPLLSYKGSEPKPQTLLLGKQESDLNIHEHVTKHPRTQQNNQGHPIGNPSLQRAFNSHEGQNFQDKASSYPHLKSEFPLPVKSDPPLNYQVPQISNPDPALILPELPIQESGYSKFEPTIEIINQQPEQTYPVLGQPNIPLFQQSQANYHESRQAQQPPSNNYHLPESNILIQPETHLEQQVNYQEPQINTPDPALNLPILPNVESDYTKLEQTVPQFETNNQQPEQNYPVLEQPNVPPYQQSQANIHEPRRVQQPPSNNYNRPEPNILIQPENNLEQYENYQEPQINNPEQTGNLPKLPLVESIYSKLDKSVPQFEPKNRQPEQKYPVLGQPNVPPHQQFQGSYHESRQAQKLSSIAYHLPEPNILVQSENILKQQDNLQEPIARQSIFSELHQNFGYAQTSHQEPKPSHNILPHSLPQYN